MVELSKHCEIGVPGQYSGLRQHPCRTCFDKPSRVAPYTQETATRLLALYPLPDIFRVTEKGKLTERWGRKASGLRDFPTTAGPPETKIEFTRSGRLIGLVSPSTVIRKSHAGRLNIGTNE